MHRCHRPNMLLRALLGAVASVLASTAMAAASVQDGIDAMRRGDFAAAYPIWTELANAGDDKAAIEAGFMHHLGRGRPVSFPDAYTWYLKAFPKNGDAWNNIGVMFRDALGVPQNRRMAYLMFLTVHMVGMGNESTVMRANRNLRREIAELPPTERQEATCYTLDYVRAFVESRGTLNAVPEALRASPQRKRIRDLNWWLPGEVAKFECPDGT
jgi:TPR repeat protein